MRWLGIQFLGDDRRAQPHAEVVQNEGIGSRRVRHADTGRTIGIAGILSQHQVLARELARHQFQELRAGERRRHRITCGFMTGNPSLTSVSLVTTSLAYLRSSKVVLRITSAWMKT